MGKTPRVGVGRLPAPHKGSQSNKVPKALQQEVHKVTTAAKSIFARPFLDKRTRPIGRHGVVRRFNAQKAPPPAAKASVKHTNRAFKETESTLGALAKKTATGPR